MQQKNSADTFFSDMQSTLKDMLGSVPATSVPFDMKTMMEAQRKNFQALTEANQRVMQGWQALAQRQAEMVSQFVQDNSGLARETMSEGTPQDKLAKQTEILKNSCEKSISNTQELGEIVRKCTIETAEVINRRIMTSLSEIKSSAKNSAE
jgi:phasin family protein